MTSPINNRYEFVMLYDVENGNPNGDPDAGNMPRIDPETGHGIVTDVCLKRKIRNYVELVKGDAAGYQIYVKEGIPLNTEPRGSLSRSRICRTSDEKEAMRKNEQKIQQLREWMCDNFFDVRTFGAVMTTGDQLRSGTWASSVQLLPQHRSDRAAGSDHHPPDRNRGRTGKNGRWAASTSCPTASTAWKATFPPNSPTTQPKARASRKMTWPALGRAGQHVRARPFGGAGQDGDPQAVCVQA